MVLLFFAFFCYGVMANEAHKGCEPLQRKVQQNLTLVLDIEKRLQKAEEVLENSSDDELVIHKNLVIFLYTEQQLEEVKQNLESSQKAYQECLTT